MRALWREWWGTTALKGARWPARRRTPAWLGAEGLEPRAMLAADQLSTVEVESLLKRASAVTPSNDAIIAIVDCTGQILGVRTESDVNFADNKTLGFAIDGAVAKARTGAFFSNNQAILTSRTVSHISQSTITQREMQADPNSTIDTITGPGYVAPVGLGGTFPPGIINTPLVDLFGIEHTNRVSVLKPGVSPASPFDAANFVIDRRSYSAQVAGTYGAVGSQAGQPPQPIARGIATLPGGIAIYRAGTNEVIGGLGVFFPGKDGTASFEQGFVANATQTRQNRLNAPKALEAELIALETLLPINVGKPAVVDVPLVSPTLATITLAPADIIARAGGIKLPLTAPLSTAQTQALVNKINNAARINLGGIALQSFGPQAGPLGVQTLFTLAGKLGPGTVSGSDQPVKGAVAVLPGKLQADGWIVPATAGSELTAAQVKGIIDQGTVEAGKTRAQIRIQPTGTKMVLAVSDFDGTILGLYRMSGATLFSIDVAVAKARNTVYYASADLQPTDRTGTVPIGTAFTNRTFRYLASAHDPSGNTAAGPGAFSILKDAGINPKTGLNTNPNSPPLASSFKTVLGYDSFNTGSNFHSTAMPAANQNGIVFFPGSTPLYVGRKLSGGFGVSGDGVDQDDVVTSYAAAGSPQGNFNAPADLRADNYRVSGIRLPYVKYSRNPFTGA
ncbi:MAG: heme-binding protein [Planctomycetota bacterium]|nr:heme-binding protein [Planctomycetota bacterium]